MPTNREHETDVGTTDAATGPPMLSRSLAECPGPRRGAGVRAETDTTVTPMAVTPVPAEVGRVEGAPCRRGASRGASRRSGASRNAALAGTVAPDPARSRLLQFAARVGANGHEDEAVRHSDPRPGEATRHGTHEDGILR